MKKKINQSQLLEIKLTQTCGAMISEAQALYNAYNTGCLDAKGQERLTHLRNEYFNIRGAQMHLEFIQNS